MEFGALQLISLPERRIIHVEIIPGPLPLSPPGHQTILSHTAKVTPHFQ
ncbi:MAG: hypothetical protein ABL951_03515 [Alphaproteobacteria bacterium]